MEEKALQVTREVLSVLEKVVTAEDALQHSYARLGYLLTEVSEKKYFEGAYPSFHQYMLGLRETFKRGKTQLYQAFYVVRDLKADVTLEQLDVMGISKANELRKAKKRYGTAPTPEQIAAAMSAEVSKAQLKDILFKDGNPETKEGKEKSFDLEYEFPLTEEEKRFCIAVEDAARHADPVIQEDLPLWAQKKAIFFRLGQEFLAGHPTPAAVAGR